MSLRTKLFYAELDAGDIIKSIVDVLANGTKQRISFQIGEDGIFIRETDPAQTMLLDIELTSSMFVTYKFDKSLLQGFSGNRKVLSVPTSTLHDKLRAVRRKDSIIIYIDASDTEQLSFRIRPKDAARTLPCQVFDIIVKDDTEFIEDAVPGDDGYYDAVTISTVQFARIKRMTAQCKILSVNIIGSDYVAFVCKIAGVSSDKIESRPYDEDEEEEPEFVYSAEFKVANFTQLAKLHGLSKSMQILAPSTDGYPLCIELTMAGVEGEGRARVYIKDANQIDFEEQQRQSQMVESQIVPSRPKRGRKKASA